MYNENPLSKGRLMEDNNVTDIVTVESKVQRIKTVLRRNRTTIIVAAVAVAGMALYAWSNTLEDSDNDVIEVTEVAPE